MELGTRQKAWVTTIGAVASVLLLLATFVGSDPVESPYEPRTFTNLIPWDNSQDEETSQGDEGKAPQYPEGEDRWIRFVAAGGEGLTDEVMIGAPGMWPSVRDDAKDGFLALPVHEARRMDGRPLPHYEVIIRSTLDEREVGFWGVVLSPEGAIDPRMAREIRVGEAATLQLKVVDVEGEPVEGAFVRLSRDSVGLLHLHYTTEEDGMARFRSIPGGTYFLTLDADGYSRQVVRLEHSGTSSNPYVLPLEDGGGVRTPYSWRGPPVEVMAGSGGSSSGGEEEVGTTDSEGEGESEVEKSVRLEVFAADERGGGVEGAWIEVWAEGARVAEGISRGSRALALEVPAGVPLEIVSTHAGWGEGSLRVAEADPEEDAIVTMEAGLFSASVARDRVRGVFDVEEILAAPLVADGKRWLVDHPDGESRAAEAGLQRGDSVAFLRRSGAGFLVVVERNGRLEQISF